MKRYICVKKVLYERFMRDKSVIKRYTKTLHGFKYIVTYYGEFFTLDVVGIIKLFYFPENPSFFMYRDFIDVTNNSLYSLSSIVSGKIRNTGIILEGADGSGKTTLCKEFAKCGYLMEDRCVKSISKIMEADIPLDQRVDSVKQFLVTHPNNIVIFLNNTDDKEIMRRIYSREEVSKYDMQALKKRDLYHETFMKLQKYEINNIKEIDITNKSVKQIMTEIYAIYSNFKSKQQPVGPILEST